MIRKVEFENFMSLRNVSVELDPFTVFVGRNGSGKSAVFKGLVTLSRLVSEHPVPVRGPRGEFFLEPGVTLDDIVWTGNSGLPIKFRVWFDVDDVNTEPGYALELRKGRAGWSVVREAIRLGGSRIEIDEDHPFEHPTERIGTKSVTAPLPGTLSYMVRGFVNDEHARPAIETIVQNTKRLGEAWRYRPSAYDIAAFSRVEPMRYVAPNGRGVAPALQELQGRKRDLFEKIEAKVREILPHIRTIGFDASPDGIRLSFMNTRCNNLVPAAQESDGVLLATFFCWRLYTAEPPITICLEEPENGFYPDLLEKRIRTSSCFQ